MFVYTIQDILGIGLVVILILICLYKLGRYQYLKRKYSKCPSCGSETGQITEIRQTFGDMESYEKFFCRKCSWEEKLRF